MKILYEDNHLLGVFKEAGRLVQGDRTGDVTLLTLAKEYLKEKYHKPGNVFLGLVHRLDRPVSGVVLFAKTSKAASRLAGEFQLRRVTKVYWAVLEGLPDALSGTLVSDLVRRGTHTRVASGQHAKAKRAALDYQVLAHESVYTLVEVQPSTGRHHQIRVQFANMGHPVAGDMKYGSSGALADRSIALHALRLGVAHPVKDELVNLEAPPPDGFPWDLFRPAIENRFG
ncbi:MAG: pseudouridine synthase [Candidatus Latescibacterota bacterium]